MTDGKTPDPQDRNRTERSEEERAAARPFDYPYPERRAGVRATRHISREEADADSVPGVPGGYGTTGGGQAGGRSTPRRHEDTADESGVTDIVGGREPRADRPNRSGGTDRE
ncbi:hypothetical protein [Streptomyces sp. JHA26]|uniref:hypothetical protein n=1 Tax=Streptomyces sp. JHA26 TaxID=1917143 RepID=UPI00098BA86D|nr:hypothetical protein [Streptomyces sp. JHA26]